jgi:hypothetical protein
VFESLPLGGAMSQLVVTRGGPTEAVERAVREPVIAAKPALVAGLWLYVDQLDRSHEISQTIDDATGSFWHGIMHRREADFGNSHYWFRRVGKHPAIALIDGYEPHAFIDEVEKAHRNGRGADALIDMQRREWAALFEWCAER